jgi:hypothetical protein
MAVRFLFSPNRTSLTPEDIFRLSRVHVEAIQCGSVGFYITIFCLHYYAYLYAGNDFANKGEAMARTQNMKKLMPSILAMAMGAIFGNSAMAAETTALQAAPAYTATQTKGRRCGAMTIRQSLF